MNAVEIEAAVSDLAAEQYDAAEFPFHFGCLDKKETTLKRFATVTPTGVMESAACCCSPTSTTRRLSAR